MNRFVVAALALVTIATTSSALAAPRHRAQALNAHAQALHAAAVVSPTAVYFAGRYVGQDPDRFIRMQLRQDGALADQ
jgi:hypothetical protein